MKLTRFEYEKKQSTSFIQDSVEEDNLLDACSDINPSTTNTDRKYINVTVLLCLDFIGFCDFTLS